MSKNMSKSMNKSISKIYFLSPLGTLCGYRRVCYLAVLMILYLSSFSVFARTTAQIPYDEVTSASLYFNETQQYRYQLAERSDYNIEITGLLARITLTQTFTNHSDNWQEAVYVFPLAEGAAVDAMVIEVGERRIIGSVKEKEQAKAIYQAAKKTGKLASLLSQQRPNLFTTKVANIAPRKNVKVTISFLQEISYNSDRFSLRMPLTITPRYIPLPINTAADTATSLLASGDTFKNMAVDNKQVNKKNPTASSSLSPLTISSGHGWAINNRRVNDASEITPPQSRKTRGQDVSINILLDMGLPISEVRSSYHQINQHIENQRVKVNLANKRIAMDRDFNISWQLAESLTPQAAFFKSSDQHFDYGLLMVTPGKTTSAQVLSKEIIYVLDNSGSMGGVAIEQAKLALIAGIELLGERDSFNVIAFSDQTRVLFTQSKIASLDNRRLASHWVGNIQAGGGTEMAPALQLALDDKHELSRFRQIVFITDGAIGNEDELFTIIENQLQDARLHTVGIGSAPNGYFMAEAAELGRGTYRYIGQVNEVQQQISQLFFDISRPLLRNIKINWPIPGVEMFPNKIPDLYADQPLIVSAKWPKGELAEVTLSGELASQIWQQKVVINQARSQSGMSSWWAGEKIKHLLRLYRRTAAGVREQLKQEVTALALEHQLLSPFTSFVAVEEIISRPNTANINTRAIANKMPYGSTQAIPMANTATSSRLYFYLGCLMLLLALLLWFVGKRVSVNKLVNPCS